MQMVHNLLADHELRSSLVLWDVTRCIYWVSLHLQGIIVT